MRRKVDMRRRRSLGVQGREYTATKRCQNIPLKTLKVSYPCISYSVIEKRLICLIANTGGFFYFPAMLRCVFDKLVGSNRNECFL